MPAYFFHITFELSPSSSSFVPPPRTDIFSSELPSHSTSSWASFAPSQRLQSKTSKSAAYSSDVVHGLGSRERPAASRRFSHRTRQSFSDHHDSPVPIVKPPTRLPDKRTHSFAPRDWRFDAVSIQSIDMNPSKSPKQPSAPGSGGLATKGKFIPSDVKDTEVGWGVVHLYRDGHETPHLYDDAQVAEGEFKEEDCTTLCILAVPSYMTPSDFLGFVGEQTREDVSHFRLIKTSRANKYMVLMKFREAKKAREWRKGWNGKTFNSMEVGSPELPDMDVANDIIARVLSRRLREIHKLPDCRLKSRPLQLSRSDKRPIYSCSYKTAYGSTAIRRLAR